MDRNARLMQSLRCVKRAFAGAGLLVMACAVLVASVGVHTALGLRAEGEPTSTCEEITPATTGQSSQHERRIDRRRVVLRCPSVPPTQSSHAAKPGRLIAVEGHFLPNGLRAPLLS